jgi:protein-tyrosine-phosphatase
MKVLFICKGNYFRSQMAEALYNHLTQTKDAYSVGTYTGAPDEPEGQILKDLFQTSDFFDVMEENGMHVRDNRTKKLVPKMLEEYEVAISMAEEPYIPDFLKNTEKIITWIIKNPTLVNRRVAEDTYNQISTLVCDLIENIKNSTL